MKYATLWLGAVLGIALHLLGLGWDAYLHAKDSTLAGREGIFTLSNPSHLLIIVGLGLTAVCVLGVAVVWTHERGLGGTGRTAGAVRVLSVAVLGVSAAGAIWLATLAENQSAEAHAHLHGANAVVDDGHDHTDAAPAAQVSAAPADGHSHATTDASSAQGAPHFHGSDVEVKASPDQLIAAATFVQKVKAATVRYEDIRVALAEGWVQVTQDLPAIAAHFIKPAYNNDGILMDPEKPETLLYTKRLDGTWRFVGVMFSSEKVTDAPPSFFGPLDVWHRHENLCFTAASVAVKQSAAECAGVFLRYTSWEMHVWTAPGATSVFGHDYDLINPGAFPAATRPAAQDLQVRAP